MVEIHQKEPMAMCPMASMCRRISQRPPSLVFTMTPGVILIVLGVIVLLEPKVLAWLVAIVTIVMGVLLMLMAGWIRRMSAHFGGAH